GRGLCRRPAGGALPALSTGDGSRKSLNRRTLWHKAVPECPLARFAATGFFQTGCNESAGQAGAGVRWQEDRAGRVTSAGGTSKERSRVRCSGLRDAFRRQFLAPLVRPVLPVPGVIQLDQPPQGLRRPQGFGDQRREERFVLLQSLVTLQE